jgi:hypothetical protein
MAPRADVTSAQEVAGFLVSANGSMWVSFRRERLDGRVVSSGTLAWVPLFLETPQAAVEPDSFFQIRSRFFICHGCREVYNPAGQMTDFRPLGDLNRRVRKPAGATREKRPI